MNQPEEPNGNQFNYKRAVVVVVVSQSSLGHAAHVTGQIPHQIFLWFSAVMKSPFCLSTSQLFGITPKQLVDPTISILLVSTNFSWRLRWLPMLARPTIPNLTIKWWFMVVYGGLWHCFTNRCFGGWEKTCEKWGKDPTIPDQKRPKRRCFCRVALRHDGAMGGCVGGWGCDAEKKWRSSQCLTCQKWGIWYHLIILYLL